MKKGFVVSLPHEPVPEPPLPPPGWRPVPPIKEPEPEDMPDETPLPNPDENDAPPQQVRL